MTGLRAVIFDFDGVVAERGFRGALKALAERCGLDYPPLPGLAMQALIDSGYVTGRGSEADWWRRLEATLGPLGDCARFRADVLALSVVRPWQLALAAELAGAGYATAVLSDHTDWLDQIETRQPFAHAFGRVFNSYYLGACKREATAFTAVADALGVPPEQAVFIDDNPDNVARAAVLRMTGIVYRERTAFLRDLGAALRRPVGAVA
ncbi:HAD-IA family hydrolase [Immundisolibacter sp.]|uniref:HAD-IA family hydrolase n=1 Tax=Immundisolibacter sp. TaxID=1934948 RepID=UPI00260EA1F3|nr:HAD-IA family hydrolase [Immundisolibacter sp.]MDD3650035.1 HAD-IA family hydrolase [Immundisolibacter sp.]